MAYEAVLVVSYWVDEANNDEPNARSEIGGAATFSFWLRRHITMPFRLGFKAMIRLPVVLLSSFGRPFLSLLSASFAPGSLFFFPPKSL
jgi:hypothetical protein